MLTIEWEYAAIHWEGGGYILNSNVEANRKKYNPESKFIFNFLFNFK